MNESFLRLFSLLCQNKIALINIVQFNRPQSVIFSKTPIGVNAGDKLTVNWLFLLYASQIER